MFPLWSFIYLKPLNSGQPNNQSKYKLYTGQGVARVTAVKGQNWAVILVSSRFGSEFAGRLKNVRFTMR